MTCIIYINGPKDTATITRVIKPGEKFKQNWIGLVEAITGSNLKEGIKNYHSFEII